tara:strand:+ start:137 stop:352 length:216 start_codon:yes stop_codon:yes gene_type:complete
MNGKDIGIHLTPNMPIRDQRNRILASTDVYVLEDHPTTKKTEWKTYRQELRDMDFSDLDNITWPTPPEEEE